MRTPSRASVALAVGGVFATIGFTGVAATSASAAPHPSLARSAVAHHAAHVLRLTLPGTGLRLSASVDDEGNVAEVDETETEADDATEVEDANDVEDAGDDQGEEAGEDQGEDAAGDDQGEDQGE